MNKENNITNLINISGCLTSETMEEFIRGRLSNEAGALVNKHLESCELCKEAIEGYSLLADKINISSSISSLNEQIRQKIPLLTDQKNERSMQGTSRKFWVYLSVAASVLLLIGVYMVLFHFRKESHNDNALLSDSGQIQTAHVIYDSVVITADITENLPKKEINMVITPIAEPNAGKIAGHIRETSRADSANIMIGGIAIAEDQQLTPDEEDKTAIETIGNIINEPDQTEEYEPIEPTRSDEQTKTRMTSLTNKAGKVKTRKTNAQGGPVMEEELAANEIFIVVEQPPSYPGGEEAMRQFLLENLEYPQNAKENAIQGTVSVTFVVEANGSLSHITLIKGIGGGCDEEALRVIKIMPKWNPGFQRGKPVRVQFVIPVKFDLNI